MNKHGNPKSLVASHPGNLNAAKQGIHSPRLIQARAAEIATELTQSFEFSPAERLAVHEAARCIAILEAIDRDLDQGSHLLLPVLAPDERPDSRPLARAGTNFRLVHRTYRRTHRLPRIPARPR